MGVLRRNNVTVTGSDARAIVFGHGFGCDQDAWSGVVPAFVDGFRVVLFDHVGAGGSDLSAYDIDKYATLQGYASDLIDILEALELREVFYVGHSVGAMIGMLAAVREPALFASLVMVCPSPSYIDEPGYVGGFSRQDLDELLEVVDSNFLGWSREMAPVIMGNDERPALGQALGASFCRTDPAIASRFARVTFLSDHRGDLPHCSTPTLVLQTCRDAIAPEAVGKFVATAMPSAELVLMDASGHCPHMSEPQETIDAIKLFLSVQ